MVKLLMICDEYLFENNDKYYAANQEKYDFFERYLRVFDSMRLVCRCEEEKDLKNGRVPLDNDPRIEFVPVPMFHGPKDYAKKYLAVGTSLRKITEGCDAALLRIPSTVAIRVGKQVMRKGLPYACEVVFDAEDGWRGTSGIARMAWKRIDKQMRSMCAGADGVSCVTEHYLQQHYFPIKPDAFAEHYSSLALDKSFYTAARSFPSKKNMVIAHTAIWVEHNGRKGHIEIIQAVKLLKERGVEVNVQFAGKDYFGGVGKLKELAQNLGVSDKVEFVGFLSRDELNKFLNDADLYVMPTKAEGLPRVIIEAMAKGLPCITTPVSGNPELITDHFLVDYNDVKTLADRIEELTQDADLYERTSRENFEKSWKYEASVLEARRDTFYSLLKSKIK